MLLCESITPLGAASEPEVNRIAAMSSPAERLQSSRARGAVSRTTSSKRRAPAARGSSSGAPTSRTSRTGPGEARSSRAMAA